MDRFRYWRHQPSLSPPNYQFIYYSLDGKTRYTSEVPNHRSKFLMMWCPKCKHAAVSVYTRVSFIEIGKKIRAHGHNFEDVISAYLNWINPMKDVTDLVGHLEALTVVKYSPRWYNILE